MTSPALIIDGFPKYQRRKHKGRSVVTPADIRQRQIEWLEKHLKEAHREGYNECLRHYQGKR